MPCKIYYFSLTDEQTKTEKLEWFKNTKLQNIDFQEIKPDKNANWINLTDNDFDNLIPLCSKDAKLGKGGNAIFELFSNGIVTARDEWVYDFDKDNLTKKVKLFCEVFEKEKIRWQKSDKSQKINDFVDRSIKWTEELEGHLKKGSILEFDKKYIVSSLYRPFVKKSTYFSKILTHRIYQNDNIFPIQENKENKLICFVAGSRLSFACIATNSLPNYAIYSLDPAQCLPLYRYSNGERIENITDWALALFRNHYKEGFASSEAVLNKTDIFHYVYAVLHKAEYRQKYEQNLKREFPRIPLYDDFWKYADAGKKLMELHINYENSPTPNPSPQGGEFVSPPFWGGLGGATPLLQRKDLDLEVFKASKQGKKKKTIDTDKEVSETETAFTVYPILKIKDGNIEIDELTTLCGVPAAALAYKLGNRSAIEWVLDQYKPYKSDDKTIQEQFNIYNFADYKEQVIELLQKVCWLSVETMKIVGEL